MQFGSKPLFENISVKFGGGNRYGLIGANGSGKSTFMKILGGDLEPLDEKYKTEQNLIDGCQSRVWVQCDMTDDGRLVFTADSDALIVKGIIALLIQVISGHTPREILDADLYFIERIGLKDHLSPTRSNGLLAMVKQIRMYALAYEAKGQC